jgi:hypothetical protein
MHPRCQFEIQSYQAFRGCGGDHRARLSAIDTLKRSQKGSYGDRCALAPFFEFDIKTEGVLRPLNLRPTRAAKCQSHTRLH